MKRFKHIVGGIALLVLICATGWIFWPGRQPTEQELLRLVPADADAVVLQRDFADHWKALRRSAFFTVLTEHSLLPARLEADSRTKRVIENAVLDLFGARAVVFVPGGTDSICLVAGVTPRTKWLWLRARVFQLLPKSGFSIFTGQVRGQTVSEVRLPHNADVRLHFGRRGHLFGVLFGGSAEALAAVLRRTDGMGPEDFRELARSRNNALQLGVRHQAAGMASWIITRTNASLTRIELTLPKQRTVRLPWDATRGPRSMALIQKLFPDQGVLTLRGRASHWMMGWDNVVAWLGLPGDMYSEALQARLKYGEQLSHGVFPWSGAGDELAWVVAPAVADTPRPWPTISGAARCWETNDMQVAIAQFLPSLGRALGTSFPFAPPRTPGGEYVVRMKQENGRESPLFCYRYVDGLVIGSNSRETLKAYDPAPFAGQTIEAVQPENEFWCKPAEIAAMLQAVAVLNQFAGNAEISTKLNSVAAVMKTLHEARLTVRVENETVSYELEARTER